MLECLIQFPSALPPRQGSGQPSLAGAIFFQFRQIPLNGANHTDKTDIPAFGMDITFFFWRSWYISWEIGHNIWMGILKKYEKEIQDISERRISLLKSIEFRSHCSFPCSVQYLPLPLKWLQCSEFKWTQLGPKLQLNLNVITNRSLRLPQVSFHFRTPLSDRFRWAIMKCANKLSGKTRVTESSLLNIQSPIDL